LHPTITSVAEVEPKLGLQRQILAGDALLLKLGAAHKEAWRRYGLVAIRLPDPGREVASRNFTFAMRKEKLLPVRRWEDRYLLCSNLATVCRLFSRNRKRRLQRIAKDRVSGEETEARLRQIHRSDSSPSGTKGRAPAARIFVGLTM
jgi:hypothetical protein